jgi:hypothetical protein
VSQEWRDQIREIVENDPERSPRLIEQELARTAAEDEPDGPPSERTIRRIRAEHLARSEQERVPHRYVRWPESFESGVLPWESARALLDEIAFWHAFSRPITVRWARWFWRLHQSAPDAPIAEIRAATGALSAMELLGGPPAEALRAAEAWLAFRAWNDEGGGASTGRAAYERAVERGAIPRWQASIHVPKWTTLEAAAMAFTEFSGIPEAAMRDTLGRFDDELRKRGHVDA